MRRIPLRYPLKRKTDFTTFARDEDVFDPSRSQRIFNDTGTIPFTQYAMYDDLALRGMGRPSKRRKRLSGGSAAYFVPPNSRITEQPLHITNPFWSTGYTPIRHTFTGPMDTTKASRSVEKFEESLRATRAAERLNAEMRRAKTKEEGLHLGNYQREKKTGDDDDDIFSAFSESGLPTSSFGDTSIASAITSAYRGAEFEKQAKLLGAFLKKNFLLNEEGKKSFNQWKSETEDVDGVPKENQEELVAWMLKSGALNGIGTRTVVGADGRKHTVFSPWLSSLYNSIDKNGYKAKPIATGPITSDGAVLLQYERDLKAKREAWEKKRDDAKEAYKEEYRKKYGVEPPASLIERALPKLVEPFDPGNPEDEILKASKLRMKPVEASPSTVANAAAAAQNATVPGSKIVTTPLFVNSSNAQTVAPTAANDNPPQTSDEANAATANNVHVQKGGPQFKNLERIQQPEAPPHELGVHKPGPSMAVPMNRNAIPKEPPAVQAPNPPASGVNVEPYNVKGAESPATVLQPQIKLPTNSASRKLRPSSIVIANKVPYLPGKLTAANWPAYVGIIRRKHPMYVLGLNVNGPISKEEAQRFVKGLEEWVKTHTEGDPEEEGGEE